MRARVVLALASVLSIVPVAARADDQPPASIDAPPERRNGFMIGTAFDFGLVSASGYPNNARFIGNGDYYVSTGPMMGSTLSIFIMGAISDYMNVGFFMGGGGSQNDDFRVSNSAGGLRLDTFPLYHVHPQLRDLGIRAQIGVGGTSIEVRRPGNWPSSDGTQSILGLGVFYEAVRPRVLGGHFVFGPSLDYDAIFSRSATSHSFGLGVRLAWYGGP